MKNKCYIIYLLLSITLPLEAQHIGLTLDSCLALAQHNNTALQKADLQVEKAKQVRSQALTHFFPQVSVSAFGYHSLHPLVEIGPNDIANNTVADLLTTLYGNYGAALGLENTISLFQYGYHVGVSAIQPVFAGGKIVTANRLAQLGVQAAELQRDIATRDALQQVEECYWLVVGLNEKQQTIAAMQTLLDTLMRNVSAAVHAGLALPTELMQVSIKQDETLRLHVQLNNGLLLAKQALAMSIGVDSIGLLNPISTDEPDDSLLITAIIDCDNSPEKQLLALQVQAAQLQRNMTLADALPQIAVGANYGYGKLQNNILNSNFGSPTGNGALFMTLRVPLTQWGKTGHQLKEHNLQIECARLEQQDMNQKLLLRKQQTYNQLMEAAWLVRECQKTVDKSKENYRLVEVHYHAGMATLTDLLTAHSLLLKAQNDLTDARITLAVTSRRFHNL